jgi:hypothetical protein
MILRLLTEVSCSRQLEVHLLHVILLVAYSFSLATQVMSSNCLKLCQFVQFMLCHCLYLIVYFYILILTCFCLTFKFVHHLSFIYVLILCTVISSFSSCFQVVLVCLYCTYFLLVLYFFKHICWLSSCFVDYLLSSSSFTYLFNMQDTCVNN